MVSLRAFGAAPCSGVRGRWERCPPCRGRVWRARWAAGRPYGAVRGLAWPRRVPGPAGRCGVARRRSTRRGWRRRADGRRWGRGGRWAWCRRGRLRRERGPWAVGPVPVPVRVRVLRPCRLPGLSRPVRLSRPGWSARRWPGFRRWVRRRRWFRPSCRWGRRDSRLRPPSSPCGRHAPPSPRVRRSRCRRWRWRWARRGSPSVPVPGSRRSRSFRWREPPRHGPCRGRGGGPWHRRGLRPVPRPGPCPESFLSPRPRPCREPFPALRPGPFPIRRPRRGSPSCPRPVWSRSRWCRPGRGRGAGPRVRHGGRGRRRRRGPIRWTIGPRGRSGPGDARAAGAGAVEGVPAGILPGRGRGRGGRAGGAGGAGLFPAEHGAARVAEGLARFRARSALGAVLRGHLSGVLSEAVTSTV